jgi:hypothetical protein
VVVVDEAEGADGHRLVEGERDHAAEVVLVWLVDDAISPAVQVMGQDQDVADLWAPEVLIKIFVGAVRIEDYEVVRKLAATACFHRYMHALGGKLVALEDRARRKTRQVDREGLALAVRTARDGPGALPKRCRGLVTQREIHRSDG